jgi:hypothetical protein
MILVELDRSRMLGCARAEAHAPFGGDTEVTLATAPAAVSQKTPRFAWKVVDVGGIEPPTPCLQSRCSPS